MANVLQVPVENVGRHECRLVFVVFLARQVENSLYPVGSVSLREDCGGLAHAAAALFVDRELLQPRVQIRVQVIIERVGFFLRAHAQV